MLFELRWALHFNDGKKSKFGQWNTSTRSIEDSPSFLNKNNLLLACIERRDLKTGEVEEVVSCKGQDFCLFKFIAVSPVSISIDLLQKPVSKLIGIKLVSRDVDIDVFIDRKNVMIRKRKESEKKINYEGF